MRTHIAAVLLLALFAPTTTFAQADYDCKPVPRGWAIAGEAAGAVVVGYGLGIVSTAGSYFLIRPLMTDPEWGGYEAAGIAALLSGIAVVPAGSALGAHTAGTMLHRERPFWPALLGGYCGMVAEAGVIWATQASGFIELTAPSLVVAFALPPAGAVIGYNMGRPAGTSLGGIEQRLEMPRMAMTMTHDEWNRPVSGVRCDLVTLRF
jgi:hypothetical protein